MAQIKVRKGADGSPRYSAVTRTAAEKWARHRQIALDNSAEWVRERHGEKTFAELIRWYIATVRNGLEMAAQQAMA